MIVFDLQCSEGHLFEGWFESAESFEDQNARDMVVCPYCSDTEIKRVMSPVSVARSHAEEQTVTIPIDYHRLAKEVLNFMKDNFENVGPRFAAEALKMHYGVEEKRNIRGSATEEEEKTLKEEGVEFFRIPLPKTEEDKTN